MPAKAGMTAKNYAEAIGTLVESSELRKSRGTLARERAKDFSWEHTALIAENLYQDLLKEK